MKQIFTLIIFCFSFILTSKAQFVAYETQSKWTFGLNFGGTWSTTDVKYKTNGGWGFTLGRSFNYDYGRVFSFDLRGRYLGGSWYGRALDSTNLGGYQGADYAGVLKPYMDTFGFSVNNFKAEVHELSLELVLHANRLRERTKWDPYIFGGIGLSWHRTMGDLYDSTGALYDYDLSQLSKSYLNTFTDQDYETALDGSTADQFRVGVMPSLGFGIGYQVAPRVTIGLEHKSTFTGIDDFDGFVRKSKYNDIYHYTSGFIKFRFRGGGQATSTSNVNASNTNASNLTSTGCLPPVINILQPTTSNFSTSTINYTIVASVTNIDNRQELTFKVNGVPNLNFTFNPQTDRFESNVILNQGSNSFELSAVNACGNASVSTSISYTTCQLPVLTQITPSGNEVNVSSSTYSFVLNAQNVTSSGMSITINNRSWSNYTYNQTNGQLSGTAPLQPGQNVFVVSATNACGTVSETFTVNYQQCLTPSINMVVPSGTVPTVTQASYTFSANIQNVSNAQNVKVKMNGQLLSGVTYNTSTGSLTGNVTLAPGTNVFEITGANDCGSDLESFTVNYQNCVPPVISMVNPSSSGTTVSTANFTLSASVTNVSSSQGMTLVHNNRSVTNFGFNPTTGSLQASVTLLPGLNTFVLTSTNNCGSDSETITVNFQNCVAPAITITTPVASGGTVTSAAYTFKALIANALATDQIVLKQNDNTISSLTFNAVTKQAQAQITLAPGINTFMISATNSCGMDAEVTTLNYNNCVPPVLTISNPTSSGLSVTNASFTLSGTVTNLSLAQQLQLTQNGAPINGVVLNGGNSFSCPVVLVPGTNTFTINATNTCGNDSKTVVVQYNNCVPPVITVQSPINGSTTTSGSVQLTAITVTNACGTDTEVIVINYQQEEQKVTICHYPPGNTGNPQTIEIPLSAWPAHEAHGDKLGPCPEVINNCIPPVITVQSPINGSTTTSGSVQLTAQVSNATVAPTITVNNRSIQTNGFNSSNGSLQMNVPLVPGQNTITITVTNACGTDTEVIVINYQQEEQKVTICHYPPGNTGNPQTIEIPLSAWPAHEAHGDKLGPCPEVINSGGGSTGNGNINSSGGIGGPRTEKLTICHYPPGNTGNPQTIEIPLSAWPAHEAHGDKLGPCPTDSTSNGQGNQGGSGSGNVNQDGTSNGSSMGTGGGRPGSSTNTTGVNSGGGSSNSTNGTTNTNSGSGSTSNGDSMGTGNGSGAETNNPPAPVANPGNNSNSTNEGGSQGTDPKAPGKPGGKAAGKASGNIKPKEEKPENKTTPEPEKKNGDKDPTKPGSSTEKTGGG
jgi:hypothetical protein